MESHVRAAYTHGYKWLGSGAVADYIPQLAKVNPNQLSVCLSTVEGDSYVTGDSDANFTIQSISKLIILITAIKDVGFDEVFNHVGMEPTGDPFNSIVRLETMTKKPLNPLINAGAIAVISCITGENTQERFEKILTQARLFLGNRDGDYNHEVYQSELKTGDKNRALAYMMKSNGVFDGEVDEILEVYFKACSIVATCSQIAYFASILANRGVSPKTGEQLMDPILVKTVVSLMATCGMYDASGAYAIRVGIPSKSGVGGGILACVPGKMGIGVFSPALDQKGNSYCGIKAMEHLSHALGLSIF